MLVDRQILRITNGNCLSSIDVTREMADFIETGLSRLVQDRDRDFDRELVINENWPYGVLCLVWYNSVACRGHNGLIYFFDF